MKLVIAGVLVVLGVDWLAGCSAAGGPAPTARSEDAGVSPASTGQPSGPSRYGQDAARIAELVPGCGRPADLSLAQAAALAPALRGMSGSLLGAGSVTSCTLRGSGVLIFTFASPAQQRRETAAIARLEPHYALGAGWVAVPTSIADPISGLSVVQAVAAGLDGKLRTGG